MTTTNTAPLTPAEALALLDPQQPQNRLALKLTLKDLVARRVLRVEQRPGARPKDKPQTVLSAGPAPAADLAPHAHALRELVASAGGGSGEAAMADVAKAARTRFGPDLSGFGKNYVVPALVARGLLEARQEKMLWLFPVTRLRHTPAGETAKRELEATLEQARALPNQFATNPLQAAGTALALGSTILLVDQLQPHYAEIAEARRQQQQSASGTSSSSGYFGASSSRGADDKKDDNVPDGNLDLGDAAGGGDFDLFDGFDGSLDAGFDALDSSFDAGGGNFGGGD